MKTEISRLVKTSMLVVAFAMMIVCLVVAFSSGHIVAIVGSPFCWCLVEVMSKQLKAEKL